MPPVDDLDRLMAVMAAAFEPIWGEAWTRRQVEDALVIGNCHYRLIDAAGNEPAAGASAAGFFLSRAGFDEEELLLFAVLPECRRGGLGERLLMMLEADARHRGARRLLLEMRRSNPAETLYRRFGFSAIGERQNYYRLRDGRALDAITFARDMT